MLFAVLHASVQTAPVVQILKTLIKVLVSDPRDSATLAGMSANGRNLENAYFTFKFHLCIWLAPSRSLLRPKVSIMPNYLRRAVNNVAIFETGSHWLFTHTGKFHAYGEFSSVFARLAIVPTRASHHHLHAESMTKCCQGSGLVCTCT